MSEVKGWAMVICFATISCSLLELITPSGKMDKIIRFVFVAFMICAIINPLASIIKIADFDYELSDSEKKQEFKLLEKISDLEIDVANTKIKELVEKTLNEKDIEPQKIDIFMDTTQENSISINKVRVNLKKENADRQGEAKKMIEEKLGLTCETIT